MKLRQSVRQRGRRTALQALLGLLAIALPCLIAGCGDNESSPTDKAGPTVTATSPADEATDISPYPIVKMWFSEAMDPATLDTLAFHIEGLRAHSIAYNPAEHKATLYPAGLAEPGTEYEVRVKAEVEDASGNAMSDDFVFSFTTGPIDCEHLRDRFEPNDSMAYARPVEMDVEYPCLVSCGNVERTDIYSFTLTEPRLINVVTQAAYADTEDVGWKIHFRRADGEYYTTLGTGIEPGRLTADFHYTFLPGTYFVETGKSYGNSHFVLYSLTVETSEPAADDGYEDNDFPDEARPITPGRHEGLRGPYLDADWFSIDLVEGQTLTVTATEITATGTTRRLRIANATGASYTSHTDTVNPAVESWTATVTGKHLMKIRWWDDVVYDLDVEVTP